MSSSMVAHSVCPSTLRRTYTTQSEGGHFCETHVAAAVRARGGAMSYDISNCLRGLAPCLVRVHVLTDSVVTPARSQTAGGRSAYDYRADAAQLHCRTISGPLRSTSSPLLRLRSPHGSIARRSSIFLCRQYERLLTTSRCILATSTLSSY